MLSINMVDCIAEHFIEDHFYKFIDLVINDKYIMINVCLNKFVTLHRVLRYFFFYLNFIRIEWCIKCRVLEPEFEQN